MLKLQSSCPLAQLKIIITRSHRDKDKETLPLLLERTHDERANKPLGSLARAGALHGARS